MAHQDEAGDQPSKALSDHVERTDGSLMWRQEWRRVTRDELKAIGTLEQTGKRVVETITGWLAHAFDSLPPSKQAELHIDLDRPEWIDIKIPEYALHELQRLAASMQGYVTKAHWKSEGWSDDQWRALGVLQAIRAAIETTHGLEARQALPLIDALLNVGVAVSKAHTVPWEPVAARGLKDQADKRRAAQLRHEEEQSDKQFVLDYYWRRHDEFKSKRQAAKKIHEAHLVLIRDWRTIYNWILEDERERKHESVQPAR